MYVSLFRCHIFSLAFVICNLTGKTRVLIFSLQVKDLQLVYQDWTYQRPDVGHRHISDCYGCSSSAQVMPMQEFVIMSSLIRSTSQLSCLCLILLLKSVSCVFLSDVIICNLLFALVTSAAHKTNYQKSDAKPTLTTNSDRSCSLI